MNESTPEPFRLDWPNPEKWICEPQTLLEDYLQLRSWSFDKWFQRDFRHYGFNVNFDEIRLTGWGYREIYLKSFIDRLRIAQPYLNSPLSIERLRRLSEIVEMLESLSDQPSPQRDELAQPLGHEATQILSSGEADLQEYVRLRCLIQGAGKNPVDSIKSVAAKSVDPQSTADMIDLSGDQSPEADPTDESISRPTWNDAERILSFDLTTCKFGAQISKGVIPTILNSFEECGWPTRLDNPVSDSDKLKDALRTLNKRFSAVQFKKDGDQIVWTGSFLEVPPKST